MSSSPQNKTQQINNNSSQMMNKFSEQEYSNYIDTSDVVIQQYKNSSISGLEKYFLKIEEWLDAPFDREENKPYVIEAEEGVGKKALLIKWMEYHQQLKNKKYPDIILSHFASSGGNSSNYFYAIYRLLNRLREALDIDQKVELLEEKLRKYFNYWLNHCSDKLEKQLKQGEVVLYDKIIIIIEAIDQFVESQNNNREANIVFWLPRCFPEKIRVIVTCDKQSNANAYFQRINCKFLKMNVEDNIGSIMIQRHLQKELFINQELKEKHLTILRNFDEKCKNPQFYKIFLCIYLPYPTEGIVTQSQIPDGTFEKLFDKMNYDKLMKVQNYADLIDFTLEFFSSAIMRQEQFKRLLRVFVLTQKGLTLEELKKITSIKSAEWRIFLAIFKVFILNYKDYWSMNNYSLKKTIQNKYKIEVMETRKLHEEISNILEKHTSNSIRKLEEQTYHLFMSKNYFKLKETISTIENFLLLFNPNNKYDLCRYWQALEEQGFDPVAEYNKAIEGFEMHYHPSSQDVFRIIVQISRFLKEFADFENYTTPDFRHPPIKGTCDQLDDIGLLRELVNLQLFSSNDKAELEKAHTLEKQKKNQKQKIQEKKDAMKLARKGSSSKTLRRKDDDGKEDKIKQNESPNKSNRKKHERVQVQILSEVESLNVEIPCNREKFKKYYLQLIYETINNNNTKSSEEISDQNQKPINCSDDEDEEKQKKEQQNGLANQFAQFDHEYAEQNQLTMQKLKECYNMKEKIPSNYYYKRWLWIQFPWACLALECDYSAKLKECFSSAIEYMSVKKENEFTKQALKIAIEAKLKKQIMYQKQDNLEQQQSFLPQINQRKSVNIQQSVNITKNNTSIRSNKSSQSVGKQIFMITEQYLNQQNLNKQLEKNFKTIENNNNQNQSSIENMSRLLEKSRVMKDKTVQHFDPLSVVQQSSQNISSVLPRIKNEIICHSNKELGLLQSQANSMKQELDHICNENRVLAKKLKEMNILQENQQKYGVNPERINVAQQQVMDYEMQIAKAEEEYLTCLLSAQRLKGILKICDNNKQQNEDYIRNLNYLLSNYKKIIKWEQDELKENQEKITTLQRINKEYQEVFQEKIDSQKKLIESIKTSVKGKEAFDQNFAHTDSLIEQSAILQQERLKQEQIGHDQTKKLKQNQNQMEKNSKIILEQHEKLLEKYVKVQEVLDISDPNYQGSFQFKKFMADCEKKNEFKSILLSRQNIINSLKQKLNVKQDYLKTVLKANNIEKEKDFEQKLINQQNENEGEENEKKSDIHLKIIEQQNLQESKLRFLHKLQMTRLHSYMVVGTIQRKLGIKQAKSVQGTIDFTQEDIIMSLDEKINIIKEKLPLEEYQLFNSGNYDFTLVYKAISGNSQNNKQNGVHNEEEKLSEQNQ